MLSGLGGSGVHLSHSLFGFTMLHPFLSFWSFWILLENHVLWPLGTLMRKARFVLKWGQVMFGNSPFGYNVKPSFKVAHRSFTLTHWHSQLLTRTLQKAIQKHVSYSNWSSSGKWTNLTRTTSQTPLGSTRWTAIAITIRNATRVLQPHVAVESSQVPKIPEDLQWKLKIFQLEVEHLKKLKEKRVLNKYFWVSIFEWQNPCSPCFEALKKPATMMGSFIFFYNRMI